MEFETEIRQLGSPGAHVTVGVRGWTLAGAALLGFIAGLAVGLLLTSRWSAMRWRHRGRGPAVAMTRWHEPIPHTADAGIRAAAPDPAGVLEEAAAALAELSADVRSAAGQSRHPVSVRGDDLSALTYGWLNELIGLAEANQAALVAATVDRLTHDDEWEAHGTATLAAYGDGVEPRIGVKAATFHRLTVVEAADGWHLEAYFDV